MTPKNSPADPANPEAAQKLSLPPDLRAEVDAVLQDWSGNAKVKRLWDRDASLWSGRDEAKWMGWLQIVSAQLAGLDRFAGLSAEAKRDGLTHVLLMGMGGSSLCPEVLARTFGRIDGFPRLLVLDSTDPMQVRSFAERIDLERTLFVVSSKSGTTLEPNLFLGYFFDRVRERLGAEKAGSRFIAVTDPGSKLEKEAGASGFRHVLHGVPSIGGRFSALSDFGMAPAALMGIDVKRFLAEAAEMVRACGPETSAGKNPGLVLGAVLGSLARRGRDKVTLLSTPRLAILGTWLEQLLAESTGKEGKALIPVAEEAVGPPEVYGKDRIFVCLKLDGDDAAESEAAWSSLEAAGHPVVRISLPDLYSLGSEFFRWEFATAVAGSILGINPFNQPDVEASKVATRKLTEQYESTGELPAERPFLLAEGISFFADDVNAAALGSASGAPPPAATAGSAASPSAVACLRAHLDRLRPGDYFALLAYIEMNETHHRLLQEIRHLVRDARGNATCLGFGPRFLHSTGQAYKGGPNTGVFMQITCEDARDLAVPGYKASFGIVKAAQARGDLEVLFQRGRRAVRLHLGRDAERDLARLREWIREALG